MHKTGTQVNGISSFYNTLIYKACMAPYSKNTTISSNNQNMIKVRTVPFGDSAETAKIFAIRTQVFVEEQQVSREEEFDEFEPTSIHLLGFLDEKPAGTARWRITEKGIKLERFAVLPDMRQHGIASALVKEVLRQVLPCGVLIYLNSQVSAVGLYEKHGFVKVGNRFTEANIEHYRMEVAKRG